MGGKHKGDALKDAIMRSMESDKLLREAETALSNLLTGTSALDMSSTQTAASQTLKEIRNHLKPASPSR